MTTHCFICKDAIEVEAEYESNQNFCFICRGEVSQVDNDQ